jgi:hypothetical protein
MADSKISDLTELTTVANDDYLVVVDKSDTTQAPSGTTKKIRKDNLVTGSTPDEKEIASFISSSKLSEWGFRGINVLPITLSGGGSSVNAGVTSNVVSQGWNRRQQSSAVAVGQSFGLVTNIKMAHMRGKFYYRTEAMWSGCGDSQIFMGLLPDTTPIGDVDLETKINMIGIGKADGDTNFHIYRNDATGLATKTDLGSNYAIGNGNTSVSVEVYKRQGVTDEIFVRINILPFSQTGTPIDSGWISVTDDLPVDNTILAVHCMGNRRADVTGTIIMQQHYTSIRV